jgi:sugar lactone lactonase YvrE
MTRKCLLVLVPLLFASTNSGLVFAKPAAPVDPPWQLSVVAGSGQAGIADGPAASAEFIMPSALAIDAHGDIYVTDSAAQRVRVVHADGSVGTVAGSGTLPSGGLWVTPGFKDGPALQAQFNRPSGIAVAPDGRIYVADTNNHCIRLVKDGFVSTFAGTCGTLGTKDGPRADTTFSYPRQLSLDPHGNLYVADFENGVRKIDAQGVVTTLKLPIDKRVTGVNFSRGLLWIADVAGLLTYDPATGNQVRIPSTDASHAFPPLASEVALGSPYAVTAGEDTDGVFYTDLRSDSIRRFVGGFVAHVSGVPREDAVLGNGWITSGLHGPMGIAFDNRDRLFVADSGHKRIVEISGFSRNSTFITDPLDLLKLPPKHSEYRILLIGNSFVWFTNDWRNSVGTLLEQNLRNDGALRETGHEPKVVSLRTIAGIKGQASLAREVISLSSFDFVLIITNTNDLWSFAPAPDMNALFHKQEADTVAALRSSSIQSMLVVVPDDQQFTPLESLYTRENLLHTNSDYTDAYAVLLEQLQGTGAAILNLQPAMRSYEAAPYIEPLYGNENLHPSAFGRAFIAEQIAKGLEALQPWKSLGSR